MNLRPLKMAAQFAHIQAPPTSIFSTNFIHFESHTGFMFWCRKEAAGVSAEENALVVSGHALPVETVRRLGQVMMFSAQTLMARIPEGRA